MSGRAEPGGLRGSLVEFGYAAGWRTVRALPAPVARGAFRAAADAAFRRRGPAVQRLSGNLRRVVGPQLPQADFDVLVRDALRSYARYWMEAFRLPSLTREQVLRAFRLERADLLGAAHEAGTGAVVALPHAGNWDAGGAWVAARGWPLTTVAERLRPEGLYERFLAYRRSLGMEIIPLRGGERPPMDMLEERVRQAHIVPLLADRDLSTRGIEVRFFGGRTRMPAGPAILALRTGAPLFVVSMWNEPELPCGRVEGPLPVPTDGPLDQRVRVLTQQIADRLAAGIAANPVDWHMLQRMWLPEQAEGAGGAGSVAPPAGSMAPADSAAPPAGGGGAAPRPPGAAAAAEPSG